MSSINIFRMKEELKAYNVEFSDSDSPSELRRKFNELPITVGQKEHLERMGSLYKEEWNWTRGFATEFIKKCDNYYRLRDKLPASPMQLIMLWKKGISVLGNLTAGEAANIIYNLPADEEQLRYIEKYGLKVGKGVQLTYGYCQYIIGKRESFLRKSRMNAIKNPDMGR